ncbi:unnamed protein product [Symbiodinium necroappetens]|uniref:Uncharacterized protein n=1 Tax=Symbiodinium necroappetens TaxID=1628268 RepID=A0A812NRZ7_9DINO|nr:unnamed protein product [Symbiodinium necroappetens]
MYIYIYRVTHTLVLLVCVYAYARLVIAFVSGRSASSGKAQDSEPAVFASTAVALARLGAPGAAALAKELGEERSELEQQVVCEALGRMPNWQAAVAHMPALMARLQDSAVNTRRAAAEAVCRLTFIGPKEVPEISLPRISMQLPSDRS